MQVILLERQVNSCLVLQNLDGPAKREAKLHVQKDSNVDDIFRLLIATFSGTKSYTEVQKKFYERRQNTEESIRLFVYLNELMQEIEQVKPESVHDREDDELCWKLVTHVVS